MPLNRSCYVELLGAGPEEPTRLGGKGASLCRLVRLGHRVPPGFVVTREAFLATIEFLGLSTVLYGLSEALARPGVLPALGEQVRDRLRSGRVPPHVLDPILAAVQELRLWESYHEGVIVRSSATVEDSAAHSFAGIFESLPIAAPEELEPAIREVWSSAFSPRALTYFGEVGLKEVPAVPAVVQRFLQAQRSGVMFTRFAGADGKPRILIEHVEGRCEKLVKGEVTPARLWLDGPEQVPEALDGLLTPAHALELAQLARNLEQVFGAPQDVEWVIHSEKVHLVQSRPITATVCPSPGTDGASAGNASAVLSGIAASPGVGAGRVHLAFNIEHALRLRGGKVLVTPMTNPDMVVAMRNSAAIVTDVGGIICHAAIVSRELGLPCVVGTETATVTLSAGEPVTVDGSRGVVFRGLLEIACAARSAPTARWADIWSVWTATTTGRNDLVPIVATAEALAEIPAGIDTAVLVPDLDLRADRYGLWQDLEGMAPRDCEAVLDAYLKRLGTVASQRSLSRVYVLPLSDGLPRRAVVAAVRRLGDTRIVLHGDARDAPEAVLDPGVAWPVGRAAVSLGSAAVVCAGSGAPPSGVGGMDVARAAAEDTIRFFGHKPGVKITGMPDAAFRARWWALLPEYGRFHHEFATAAVTGEFEWLEVRPELVISALLKSLVQPGFEMVSRVLGLRGAPPLYIKWVKCRYHFRSDTFAQVWRAIVRATWDEAYMADLMRRVRASYDRLRQVLVLFPETDEGLAALSGDRMAALVTSWWDRWVEFFALCWFIQAQGDDILYPFLEESAADNLARIGPPPGDFCWPAVGDFIAPTTPVMSGEYMADVGRLRERLLAVGLHSPEAAEAALAHGEQPALAALLTDHLRKWHWMRDRDLLFEPWDTPARVIRTALKTEVHAAVPYQANLQRNLLALGFHFDLAHVSGRAIGLLHAARFLHDLNVERENHHILWLKFSYPLRRLFLELERRLLAADSLEPGDIFFLQAPELIEAARNLPAPLPPDLASKVKNRRRGYLLEARLPATDNTPPTPEDDYY
jgi:phosphohistidine swiveling domain-containing protein